MLALVGGLVIGLVLGIVVSVAFILPNMTQQKVFAINPVQVSGTVSESKIGTIQFVNENESASTRYDHNVQLTDGKYSITLSGGYSYNVYLGTPGLTGYLDSWILYVPSNVTNLTVNFYAH